MLGKNCQLLDSVAQIYVFQIIWPLDFVSNVVFLLNRGRIEGARDKGSSFLKFKSAGGSRPKIFNFFYFDTLFAQSFTYTFPFVDLIIH